MASTTNNSEKSEPRYGEFAVAEDGTILLVVDGKEISFPLDQATGIVMTVIAARKVGYEDRRKRNAAEKSAKKAEREKSKKERDAKRKSAAKEQAKKLREKLAKLEALTA